MYVTVVTLGGCELIETLWNVNKYTSIVLYSRRQRINRNIVECKF